MEGSPTKVGSEKAKAAHKSRERPKQPRSNLSKTARNGSNRDGPSLTVTGYSGLRTGVTWVVDAHAAQGRPQVRDGLADKLERAVDADSSKVGASERQTQEYTCPVAEGPG